LKHGRAGIFVFPFALCLASAALSAPAFRVQARREPGTLNGNVYIAGGNQPAENISVELHSNEGTMIAPQTTDANGWFEFRGLERTVHTIAIHADRFEPVSVNFDLTFNSSRGNVISLNAIPKKSELPTPTPRVSAHELSMPENARGLMQSGKKKLYQDKDAQASLADFQTALTAAPGHYEAWYPMAMAYLTTGKREDAENCFRKSIDGSKGAYGDALIGWGALMLDKRNVPEGEKLIRRGVELSPDSWMGHYELGRAQLNENKIPEAKESAELARSLAPSTPIIYRLLSNIHLHEKDYPALLQDLETSFPVQSLISLELRSLFFQYRYYE
jgi:tetratricopeptide (TPR) repeat protein